MVGSHKMVRVAKVAPSQQLGVTGVARAHLDDLDAPTRLTRVAAVGMLLQTFGCLADRATARAHAGAMR